MSLVLVSSSVYLRLLSLPMSFVSPHIFHASIILLKGKQLGGVIKIIQYVYLSCLSYVYLSYLAPLTSLSLYASPSCMQACTVCCKQDDFSWPLDVQSRVILVQ